MKNNLLLILTLLCLNIANAQFSKDAILSDLNVLDSLIRNEHDPSPSSVAAQDSMPAASHPGRLLCYP